MSAGPNDFVEVVARARGLRVTGPRGGHAFRLEPRDVTPAWHCDLDEGTPTGENDPASWVRWVWPALRAARSSAPLLEVRRPGPHSDLGRALARLGRLAGRRSPPVDGRYAYTDPLGILDGPLRHRLENWPPALHGDGVVRPAELWSIQLTAEGLVVTSVSWWGSAPALEHQIALSVEVADRLSAAQGRDSGQGGG